MALTGNISAKDFINDVRGGMSDSELMDKYKLTPDGLQSLAKKILASRGAANKEPARDAVQQEAAGAGRAEGRPSGGYSPVWITVYDESYPEIGSLGSITEKEISVVGIEASVDEVREFTIRADDFREVDPIELEVICRWTKMDEPNGDYRAGFEIIGISETGDEQLRKLIRLFNDVE